jgi:hypothetical protein
MPQLISLLETDRLDFGILPVYTCSAHCDAATEAYVEEVIVPQFEPESWSASRRGDQEEMEKKIEEVFD